MNIETIIEKYPHLESILQNTAIGLEVELKSRGICPDCLEYLDDRDRCSCEQAILSWLDLFKEDEEPDIGLIQFDPEFEPDKKLNDEEEEEELCA